MRKLRLTKSKIRNISGVIIFVIIWEVAAHILAQRLEFGSTILPTIEDVFLSIPKLAVQWKALGAVEITESWPIAILVLLKQSGITVLRVIGGTIIGMFLGIILGLLSTLNNTINRLITLPVQFARQIPLLVLIPLFLLWFGGREIGIYIYVTFGIFIILFVSTVNAVNNVPIVQKQFARTLGANKKQIYTTVIIPSIMPEIGGAISVSLALAWAITLGGEYLGAQSGLGRMLILSEYFLYTERMILIVLLFMFYSIALNAIFRRIFLRFIKWKPLVD